MKDIIFRITALILLVGGSLLFERFQEKIEDDTWLIVLAKIIIAFTLLVAFIMILKWAAGLSHIEWTGN